MPGNGQDAAAAASAASGDDGTASFSSASRARRKHRSRSPTKTTNNNNSSNSHSRSSRSPDSLIGKVGNACDQHKSTLHDSNPTSSDNVKSFAHWMRPTMFASDETLAAAQDDMPRKGFKQMSSLCQVLIKIEEPSGDLCRAIGTARNPGMASAFLNCNRNKRSLSLDLKQAEGLEAFMKVIETLHFLM